jgi:ankyrin repeat protein
VNGREAVVRRLLEKDADIELRDKDGRTPLWQATENGHEAVVDTPPEKGADIESKDKDSRMPVLWAADILAGNLADF